MNGTRIIGSRKANLVNKGVMRKIKRLSKLGIDGGAFLKMKYGISKPEHFYKINTKNISGVISELAEMG